MQHAFTSCAWTNGSVVIDSSNTDAFFFNISRLFNSNITNNSSLIIDESNTYADYLSNVTEHDETQVIVNAISAQTTRVDGLIEDDSGDQFTAKALSQTPTSGTGGKIVEVGDWSLDAFNFAPPAPGTWRVDDLTIADSTKLWIHDIDQNGDDRGNLISFLFVVGSALYIQQVNDRSNNMIIVIDAITEVSSYFEVDYTIIQIDGTINAGVPFTFFNVEVGVSVVDANVVSVTSTPVVDIDDFKADVSNLALETSVQAIPTNPLLTNDARLDNLDATISSRPTSSEIDTELSTNHGAGSWEGGSGGTTPADVWSYVTRGLTEDVTTDTASRDASKADVSNLDVAVSTRNDIAPDNAGITANGDNIEELRENQVAENEGIKKSSLIIPYTDDLPNP